MKNIHIAAAIIVSLGISALSFAEDMSPYGDSHKKDVKYQPVKIALNFSSTPETAKADLAQLAAVLKQMQNFLPKGSKISVVAIGGGIGVFAKENYLDLQAQMDTIAELSQPTAAVPVDITYCGNSMKGAGYTPADMEGFGEIVPGGYLELARLAGDGYMVTTISDYKTRGARAELKNILSKSH